MASHYRSIDRLPCDESITLKCPVKKVSLKTSQNSQGNTYARVPFLTKLSQACKFIKKGTLAKMFSCEFYKIFKTTFYYGTLPEAGFLNIALL